jgi:hypothetical protein
VNGERLSMKTGNLDLEALSSILYHLSSVL